MRKKDKFLQNLATSVDIVNTLSGGITEPRVQLFKLEDQHEIQVKVPGIDPNTISVEIHNNILTIFYSLDVQTQDTPLRVPLIVYHKTIPYYIDIERIEATVVEDQLIVQLPFNELANGYHRKVNVQS